MLAGRPVPVRRVRPAGHSQRAAVPVFRKLWEDGAEDRLPRAEAWLREAAPAITARLTAAARR